MELKFKHRDVVDSYVNCSNRTFMELKCTNSLNIRHSIIVLIVPLWN